jgi:site-specific DNA recombinase
VLFHYLKGLLFCERCRRKGRTSRMIYVEAKGRSGAIHPYYLCRGRQEKVCNLPHLPVALVEESIVRHYASLRRQPDFLSETVNLIEETMGDEQRTVHDLHDNCRKQLKALDVREERLLDLATDDELPREKIRARLRKIAIDRQRTNEQLSATEDQLGLGAEALKTQLGLLSDPQGLYRQAPDDSRRQLNQAFFERLYLDERGVTDSVPTAPLAEIVDAASVFAQAAETAEGTSTMSKGLSPRTEPFAGTGTGLLADGFSVTGSSRRVLVEVLRRYSSQTYQTKKLKNLRRVLEAARAMPREATQIGHIHRLDVRLGDEELAQVVSGYQSGLTVAELQTRFGLGKGSVLSVLHEAGVEIRRKPLDQGQLAAVIERYESGLSIREVATKLGIPKTTVQDALARSSVVMRPAVRVRRT